MTLNSHTFHLFKSFRSPMRVHSIQLSSLCDGSQNEMYDIKGKVAIVTGAASGIGLSCAKELLRNCVKAVTIVDINQEEGCKAIKEIEGKFGCNKAIFIKADVTNAKEFEDVFKTTVETWKGIDIIVNNAGMLNDACWELEITLNCISAVRGTLLALRYMSKDKCGKGGVVVNVASILGLQPLSSCPVYVGTKHFLVGFDRSLGDAVHYKRTGVKILTICPGVTDTPLITDANRTALTEVSPTMGEELAKQLGALPPQPTKNVGTGLITLITTGKSGTIWVSEGNQPLYQAHIPDRHTFKK